MEDQDVVVAYLEIDYARAIGFRDALEVHLDVPSIGESSITMAYDVYADGELAATASTVQVIVDPETSESRPVPDEILDAIVEYHGLER
jgi:acyl-CoA thioester hydrolase